MHISIHLESPNLHLNVPIEMEQRINLEDDFENAEVYKEITNSKLSSKINKYPKIYNSIIGR